MEQTTNLITVVREVVSDYHGPALKARSFFLENTEEHVYAVVIIADYGPQRRLHSGIVVMARVEDDYVIIEEDTTDRPLWEALVQAGVPRENIIVAYVGEALPAQG